MENDTKNKPKGSFEKNPLLILIWAVMPIVVIFGIGMTTSAAGSTDQFANTSILKLSIAQLFSVGIMLVLPAILISYVYKKDVWGFLNLKKAPLLSNLALAFVIILSANLFLNYLFDLNEWLPLPDSLSEKFHTAQDNATASQAYFLNFNGLFEFFIVFITMAIAPAIAEEMYFRGLLEGVLFDMKIGPVHAIIISSFLFAIMHFQFYYLLPLFFMGALLGYFYYRTKNLWLTVFVHLLNNGMIVLITMSNKTNLTNIDLEANPPLYLSLIGCLVFCISIYFFHQKTTKTKF